MKPSTMDVYSIKLAVNQMPKLTIDRSRDIVRFGPKNDFPAYLMFLYKNHPIHGAIVKGKARYLSGTGIKAKEETFYTKNFLDHANPLESWYDLSKKYNPDKVLSGGFFLKVVSNALGQPISHYHLAFAKCRISPCHEWVRYSEDWSDLIKYPIQDFPVWRPGFVGTAVRIYKTYSPNKTFIEETYAEPEYIQCLLDIDTDIRIGSFSNSLVKNNFSAGNIITVYNGETDKEKKAKVAESLKFNHEGEENAGKSVVIFANKDAKSTEVQSINTNDQDKQYVEVNKRDQQNILAGHGVNGMLFKIKTEGQLGGRTELIENHELFINEYVKIEQEPILRMLSEIYEMRYGQAVEFEIEQVSPIGVDWLSPEVNKFLTNDEIREKLGLPVIEKTSSGAAQQVTDAINTLSPLVANKVLESMSPDEIRSLVGLKSNTPVQIGPDGMPIPVQEQAVNSNLKGLAGRENQDLKRIVREYNSQTITLNQAVIRLVTGFGMTEDQARKYLGENDTVPGPEPVQQSADKSVKFFELFTKYAHDINSDDEVIDTREVNFKNASEAVRFERVRFKDYINDPLSISIKDLTDAVLNEIKGNPALSPEDIGKILKIDTSKVDEGIDMLKKSGLIAGESGNFTPTDKGINKPTDNVETEVYTEYVYAKRSDVSGDTLIPTSRQFCRDLVTQTKQKALSFESIMQLENDFGENVWDYRGGFYTKPGTGETTPWCRHVWQAVTKIRRTKK